METAWCGFEGMPTPLSFGHALKTVCVRSLADVVPALEAVDVAVRTGARRMHAVGFVAYEAASAFDAALMAPHSAHRGGVGVEDNLPLLWFSLYEEVAAIPAPAPGTAVHPANGAAPAAESRAAGANGVAASSAFTLTPWVPDRSRSVYDDSIACVRRAIADGDTYQVNFTLRLSAQLTGDAAALHRGMLAAQRCGFGAYIDTGRHKLLSASPELFFKWTRASGRLVTRPMKGTRRREPDADAAADAAEAATLQASGKDRAENLMIVDLLRNDVAKLAARGSVRVPRLFDVERYPTVYQMTSTVEAVTAPGTSLVDVFRALFPCGSVTGAPKVSTMRLISELEGVPRGVYCGAIVYVSPDGDVTASVPIRTVQLDAASGGATYGVGGGVTWGSTAEGEYDELLAKATIVQRLVNAPAPAAGPALPFSLLETLRCQPGSGGGGGGGYTHLAAHLARMAASAAHFGYPWREGLAAAALAAHAGRHSRPLPSGTDDAGDGSTTEQADAQPAAPRRVRLLANADGSVHVESVALPSDAAEPRQARGERGCCAECGCACGPSAAAASKALPIVVLACRPVPADCVFLRHKTTNRAVYDEAKAGTLALLRQRCAKSAGGRASENSAAQTLSAAAASPVEQEQQQQLQQQPQPGVGAACSCPSADAVFDVLLHSDAGFVTEFTIGNVVADFGPGKAMSGLVTPPLAHGLLPGIMRAHALQQKDCGGMGPLQEADIRVADLASARRLWLLNSVRGWVEVRLARCAGCVS